MRRSLTLFVVLALAALCVVSIVGCGGKGHTQHSSFYPIQAPTRISRTLKPSATAIFPVRHMRGKRRPGKVTGFTSASAPVVGEILTTSNGTWLNTPAGFTFQWQRCASGSCSNITGATDRNYTITSTDLGDSIKVIVTASNPGGSTSSTSSPTGIVTSGITCTLYASPAGSDTGNTGGVNSPFLTVSKLESSLTAGQVGCLNPGSYGSITSASNIGLNTSGSVGFPITITSTDPSNPATINGWVSINGNYVTLQDVYQNGSNTAYTGVNQCGLSNVTQPSDIEGNNDILQYIDYTQTTNLGNGWGIGFGGAGHGANTIVRYSAIHDIGNCQGYDHPLYLSHGDNTQIYDNWLWNDAHGFGVQVYPCPNNANIHSNVIDKLSEGFTVLDGSGCTVSNNALSNNVVSNSVGNANITSQGYALFICCGGPLGSGNTFNNNDSFNNPGGIVNSGISSAMTTSGNITSDPLFVNAATHNYAVQSGSPVAGYGLPTAVGPKAGP